MTENDVLALLIITGAVVRLATAALKHRAMQKAADRKAAKEATP